MNRHVTTSLLLACVICGGCASGPDVAARQLILQSRQLAEDHGDQVWPGFFEAPFGILLIEGRSERLYCHPGSLEGFHSTGTDPVLSCPFGVRRASFPQNMLASFPAVGGIPTIVIGTPSGTEKTDDEWILTVIHEHFHQMQFSRPDYYEATQALGLSEDDESGMWMLNYPFPYEREETAAAFDSMAQNLLKAFDARGTESFDESLHEYWRVRELARQTVSAPDWRYIELQFWQEGVARWTEGAIATLSDDFSGAASEADARIRRELVNLDLPVGKRSAVYPIGAAEAALLEAGNPAWRTTYWSEPFSLGPELQKMIGERP